MVTPALRLDMALYSTSIAYDLAQPIITLFTLQVCSSTLLRYI
jgi:hypothetical protein